MKRKGYWAQSNIENRAGFTLIELLIVMAMIAVFVTLFITTFPASQRRARDARRMSDLRQYETLLKKYTIRGKGFYPSRTTAQQASVNLCSDLGESGCPEDPRNVNFYQYLSDGTGSGNPTASNYVLWATLENPSPTAYFVLCSNGKSGQRTSVPGSYACPF